MTDCPTIFFFFLRFLFRLSEKGRSFRGLFFSSDPEFGVVVTVPKVHCHLTELLFFSFKRWIPPPLCLQPFFFMVTQQRLITLYQLFFPLFILMQKKATIILFSPTQTQATVVVVFFDPPSLTLRMQNQMGREPRAHFILHKMCCKKKRGWGKGARSHPPVPLSLSLALSNLPPKKLPFLFQT